MNLSVLKQTIKKNKKLKKTIHYLIMNPTGACPRKWVKWFVNPFIFHYGKGSKIRSSVILNISPINLFSLGNNSVIEYFTIVDNAVGQVIIGNESRIGLRNTLIGPIQIGSHVIIAQNVVISGLNHIYIDISLPIRAQGVDTKLVIIEDDAWIGANSVITAGISIGKHAVVAGGSVVTKSVPPYTIVGGNPARIIKQYDKQTKEWRKVL